MDWPKLMRETYSLIQIPIYWERSQLDIVKSLLEYQLIYDLQKLLLSLTKLVR